jgi:hypothetical protein
MSLHDTYCTVVFSYIPLFGLFSGSLPYGADSLANSAPFYSRVYVNVWEFVFDPGLF